MMDETDLQAVIKAASTDAAEYVDEHLAPDRERAQDYYDGKTYGRDGQVQEAEAGRSNFVLREVADIVHQMLPGLCRIFTGTERAVEYRPFGPEDVEAAEQATDYIRNLLDSDGNNWFVAFHDALHNALLKKTGVFKWWADDARTVTESEFTGLDMMQLSRLLSDPEVEILELEQEGVEPPPDQPTQTGAAGAQAAAPQGPPGGPGGVSFPGATPAAAPGGPAPDVTAPPMAAPDMPEPLLRARIRRTRARRVTRVAAIPPEEFIIARAAREVETASYVGHRTLPTVSDLVARGYDRATVEHHAKADRDFGLNNEEAKRNPAIDQGQDTGGTDKSLWFVLYIEHFVRVDMDDDGIAELRKICTLGDEMEIVANEIVPEAPFAVMSPVRSPHMVVGRSVADQTSDLQDVKSNILQATLDSLAQSIFPRTTVVENAVNLSDVLNNEVGAIIRMQAPGMVQTLSEPFIGPQALGVLGYLDEVRAQRTGVTRASQGLDPDTLQSTTRAAVTMTAEAAQERTGMIARTVAETGLKALFRGLLRHIIRHQDKPRMERLRGKWVEVDPRWWNADMDVIVNVGLGTGTTEARSMLLDKISAKQEQFIATLGPANPISGLDKLRETYAEIIHMAGYKDAGKFFAEITPEAMQALQQQMAKGPPDPNEAIVKVEIAKAQAQMKTDAAKLRLEEWKARQADDRERDRNEADAFLRAQEIQAKYGAQVDMAALRNIVERDRALNQAAMQVASQERQAAAQREHEAANPPPAPGGAA